MPPSVQTDPLLQFLVSSQKEQNETLGDMRDKLARIETRLDAGTHSSRIQDETLKEFDARLALLEHENTRAKTALQVTWAILGLAGSVFGALIGWLLNQH